MTDPILNLKSAPDDPVERLVWLGGVQEQVDRELDAAFTEAYFWSRFTGRLETAIDLGIHSRKRIMAYTRHGNEAAGRMIRWGDRH